MPVSEKKKIQSKRTAVLFMQIVDCDKEVIKKELEKVLVDLPNNFIDKLHGVLISVAAVKGIKIES